jgi:PKD repeat protein
MKAKSIIVATATLAVLALSSCMKKPMACVDSESKTGTVGQAVAFDGSCSMDAMHTEWDFGDGAMGEGTSISHAYNSKGTYTVKMKAMSKNMKKEDAKSITVTIN